MADITTTATGDMTDLALPPGLTPEMLIAAKAYMEQVESAKRATRDARVAELATVVRDVASTLDVETWYKTDKDTKKKTDQVSGIGWHLNTTMPVEFPDGTQRSVRVSLWVKANPNGGVPAGADDDAEN